MRSRSSRLPLAATPPGLVRSSPPLAPDRRGAVGVVGVGSQGQGAARRPSVTPARPHGSRGVADATPSVRRVLPLRCVWFTSSLVRQEPSPTRENKSNSSEVKTKK